MALNVKSTSIVKGVNKATITLELSGDSYKEGLYHIAVTNSDTPPVVGTVDITIPKGTVIPSGG